MARRRRRGKRSSLANLPTLILVTFAAAGAVTALVMGTDLMSTAAPGDATPTPSGAQHPAMQLLVELDVMEPDPEVPPYDRDDWRHWVDEDGDCQNARHEVLIAESLEPVSFTNERECNVAAGRWIDPYTGAVITVASELDIDHMVPLANAHRSGGWAWDAERREAFANYLAYEDHLIAVSASANRSKADSGPEEWKPPLEAYWCDYAQGWITIKAEWQLSVTPSERVALEAMLATC